MKPNIFSRRTAAWVVVVAAGACWATTAFAASIAYTIAVGGRDRTATVEAFTRDGVSYVPLGQLVRQWGGNLKIETTGIEVEIGSRAAVVNPAETLVSSSLGQFHLSRPLVESGSEAWIATDDVEAFLAKGFGAAPAVAMVATPEPAPSPTPTTTTTPPGPDRAARPVVVIDPGHGGDDRGAEGEALSESEMTLALASRLQKALQDHWGVEAVLTRNSDANPGTFDRVNQAIASRGTVFVSIHGGASYTSNASGFDIFYPADVGGASPAAGATPAGAVPERGRWGYAQRSRQLAEELARGIANGTTATDRGIRPIRSPLLHLVPMPSVLVEAGYLTSASDEAALRNEAYQDRLARAMAEGIGRFLGLASASTDEEAEP